MASYRRPSKRIRKAPLGDIIDHLKHGCCLGCIIKPPHCEVTDHMLAEAWPLYRHQIVSAWQAGGGAAPWGVRVFERVAR